MSIDSSVKEERLGVQIQVSSKKIQKLLEKGISPSDILSKVIENLSDNQIDDIAKDGKIKNEEDVVRKAKGGVLSLIDDKTTGVRCPECKIMTTQKNYFLEGYNRCYVCEAWRGRFKRYMEFLVNRSEEDAPKNPEDYLNYDAWDFVQYPSLVSLLIAYYLCESNSPTTRDLNKKRLRNDYVGVLSEYYGKETVQKMWHEELRTAKTRLTVEAKHRGLEAGPFRPPYGNGEKRKHPMFPLIYNELKEFFEPTVMPRPDTWNDEQYLMELSKLKSKRAWIVDKYRHVPFDQRRIANYDID